MEHNMVAGDMDLDLASKPRSLYGSKLDNGRVLVIGGSARFHGAPVLASNAAYLTLAALRTGAGYVVTCVPRSIVLPVRKLSPNMIVVPLSGDNVNAKDLSLLKKEAEKADVVIVGPGLGREKASLATAAKIVSYCMELGKKIIVDADAIRALRLLNWRLNKNVLITPNDNEFLHIFKVRLDKRDLEKRIRTVANVAKNLNANVLLKGHVTILSDGSVAKIIRAKTAALATMGTGDVLAGIIGGLAARKNDMLSAAAAGAFVHARIGDVLYKEKGYHAIASDVVDYIPRVMKEFDRTIG